MLVWKYTIPSVLYMDGKQYNYYIRVWAPIQYIDVVLPV